MHKKSNNKSVSTVISVPKAKVIKTFEHHFQTYADFNVPNAAEDMKESLGLTDLDSSTTKKIEIKLEDVSQEFIGSLMTVGRLSKKQRATIIKFIPALGLNDLKNKEVASITELFLVLKQLDHQEPTMCVLMADRWYPISFKINLERTFLGAQFINGAVSLQVADQTAIRRWCWFNGEFIKDEKPIKRSVVDLLRNEGLRPIEEGELKAYRKKMELVKTFKKRSKTVHDLVGPVLVHNPWTYMNPLQERILGSEKKPRKIILEDELEISYDSRVEDYYDNENVQDLPFVRAFSLDLKEYVYVDVSNIRDHKFDSSARNKLVLPPKMQGILDQIFEVDSDDIFGDMFGGRHGGMIVLANGKSGVGKTLTAEVFAEHTKRPLYVLEMGELGTKLDKVEQNLMKIFMRATRWNAILLFDEADIFLSKRGEDLDRNAIVGVFLRLLDHYDGMLFLTTNRSEVIDPAFKSRITLALNYPDLTTSTRVTIWKSLLKAAGFTVEGDLDRVLKVDVNGRQIRNLVRLLRVTTKERTITQDNITPLFEFIAK